jgi:hypothetical protein
LEGFQTSIRLGGYVGRIYSAHDIWTFCVAVAVWYRELEQGDSWFHYHAQWHIYFVHFACEQDGKILFYYIHFFNCCFIWECLFSLHFDDNFANQFWFLYFGVHPFIFNIWVCDLHARCFFGIKWIISLFKKTIKNLSFKNTISFFNLHTTKSLKNIKNHIVFLYKN